MPSLANSPATPSGRSPESLIATEATSGGTERDPLSISPIGDPLRPGEVISARYVVQNTLDNATAGAAVKAYDVASGLMVAIKVCIRGPAVRTTEERVERLLRSRIGPEINLFCRVLGSGMHGPYRYVVSELFEFSLMTLIETKILYPLRKRQVREIAVQLVKGLRYLHSLHIAHTDIKPSNVVLRRSDMVKIRRMRMDDFFVDKFELASVELCIVNFDYAVIVQSPAEGRVGSNAYRAPEVTMGLLWTERIDLFSLGCVLAEVYLGRRLFPIADTDLERMALLERVIGPFPEALADRGARTNWDGFVLEPNVRVNFPGGCQYPRDVVRNVLSAPPLSSIILNSTFFSLCQNLLQLDPDERHAAADYETHPFLLDMDDDMLSPEPLMTMT